MRVCPVCQLYAINPSDKGRRVQCVICCRYACEKAILTDAQIGNSIDSIHLASLPSLYLGHSGEQGTNKSAAVLENSGIY